MLVSESSLNNTQMYQQLCVHRAETPETPSASCSDDFHTSKKRSNTAQSSRSSLPPVHEVQDTEISGDSTSSQAQLAPLLSPSSTNTSPVAVPPKRQNTNKWSADTTNQATFVPPHLLSAQTLPSDFVFAEGTCPVGALTATFAMDCCLTPAWFQWTILLRWVCTCRVPCWKELDAS